jgi:hypothetical protein
MEKAGLPKEGGEPFEPRLVKNRKGDLVIDKAEIKFGPKKGKVGFVDKDGRIWIKDRAHAGDPDHWDVQVDGEKSYFRVSLDGTPLN